MGNRMEKYFDVKYVFQQLDKLPEGYTVPAGREKPWGTGHAVLCCRGIVDGPFAVINADDFYGKGAYQAIYDFLKQDREPSEYAMVGYKLRNTVTENGYVARGICEVENGWLKNIAERTHIEKRGENAAYTEDGVSFTNVSGDSVVSMNCWGFSTPFVANEQLVEGKAAVRVLDCSETWYGMTYREDLDSVRRAIADMRKQGIYPDKLWT